MKKGILGFVLAIVLCLSFILPVTATNAGTISTEHGLMLKAWDSQPFSKIWRPNCWALSWNTKTDRWQLSIINPVPLKAPYKKSNKPPKPINDKQTYYQWDSINGKWLINGSTDMSTMYESNTDRTHIIGWGVTYGALLFAQTFTPDTNHTVTYIVLAMARVGSPGTITVNIKAVDGDHHPTGAALATGTYDGDTLSVYTGPDDTGAFHYINFSLGAGTALRAGTEYAIEISAVGGDVSNYVATLWNGGVVPADEYTGGAIYEYIGAWGLGGVISGDYDYEDIIFEEWNGEPYHTVPLATTIKVLCARPRLITDEYFAIPCCGDIGVTGYPPCIPQNFNVPVCAINVDCLEGIHTHQLAHKILLAQYFDAPLLLNRVYIVGVDDSGNPVYGESDSVSGLEISRKIIEPMISTTANANTVANVIIVKERLNSNRGEIVAFPHPGLEIGDVIKVTDSPCNQSANTYRVKGLQVTYNPQKEIFYQTITLTAV